MEKKGAVNMYKTPGGLGAVYVVNLAAGTTPFIRFFNGKEHHSTMYCLPGASMNRPLVVTHANYRPRYDEFKGLTPEAKDHVLNGGLLSAPLHVACLRQLPDDPVDPSWNHDRFQVFCQATYGVKRDEPNFEKELREAQSKRLENMRAEADERKLLKENDNGSNENPDADNCGKVS